MTTHHFPLLRMLLPFVAGIILAIYQEWSSLIYVSIFIVIVFLFGLVLFLSRYKKKYLHDISFIDLLLPVSFFFGGICIVFFQTDLHYNNHFHNYDNNHSIYEVELIAPINIKPKSVQCKVRVVRIIKDQKMISVNGKALLYIEKSEESLNLLNGDQLSINTNWSAIKEPTNPGQFNYQLFLKFHQIYDQSYLKADQWELIGRNKHSLYNFSNRCRNYFLELFRNAGISGQEFAVATALTLGYKDELSNQIKHAYSSAGAMHVLAVSGLHVGIIYLIFNGVLSIFFPYKRVVLLKTLLILIIIWAYALLTGFSPSVLRATTMLSFIIIGNSISRNANIYNTLAASAFFLLIIDPFLIMQVGFQLSYLAVIGIVFFQPRIYNKLTVKNKILDYIWSITAVSLAAQLVTFPLGLLYFHQFPTYFLMSNLIVIPAAFVLLILGVLLFLTSFFNPISTILGMIMNEIVEWVNYLVLYIDQLPFSLIEGVSISIKETYIIYTAIVCFAIGFSFRKFKFINYGLGVIIILFMFDLQEDHALNKNHQLVIYDVNGHVAIDLIIEKDHLLISENELYQDQSSMLFNIKHHWYDLDLNPPVFIDLDSMNSIKMVVNNDTIATIDNGVIHFGDKDLMFVGAVNLKPIERSAIILLNGKYKGDYLNVMKKHKDHFFIGLSDLSYSQRLKIKRTVDELKIDYFDIKDEGAFTLNFAYI